MEFPYRTLEALSDGYVREEVGRQNHRYFVLVVLPQCITTGTELNPLQRGQLLKMSSCLAQVYNQYPTVAGHKIIKSVKGFSLTFDVVSDLYTQLMNKMCKIVVKSGRTIVRTNPSYLRSSKFDRETFLFMCLYKSFLDEDLSSKWLKLYDLSKIINNRLCLLVTMLDVAEDLLVAAPPSPTQSDKVKHIKSGNKKAGQKIIAYNEAVF